ncbi:MULTISPECIES: ABC transporter permease [unclassified Micromonospora]|uniref:ABC transporter permease n=1 Tax=unclassified Micromonospora TaxID=2617518 RepID=UPI0010349ADC|nr:MULTISPECIES: ABC transporter permease [unclassified Micromonospora]QKW13524.1 ABC transporter permease [Verrucosispora sp. NA02020]TBL39288.1 ABC transporter permease [Verrucosispora sp. SN26_14.1]
MTETLAADPTTVTAPTTKKRPRGHRRWRLWVPGTILTSMLAAAYLAPLPHDPAEPSTNTLTAPDGEHWMGTDKFGLDVFSRLVASAGVDIPLALAGMLISLVIGVLLGLAALHRGPWGERVVRALDVFQAFPLLILAIALVALMGNNIENVVVAIAIINVPRFVRLVRSEGLTIRESRYIEAAHAIGATGPRVMFRHVLPNMTGIILAQASLAVAHSIVVIASLSFLGIGINAADASWGAMIQTGAQNMTTGQWWVSVFPGLAIFLTVLCFNAISDELQDTFGRARQR